MNEDIALAQLDMITNQYSLAVSRGWNIMATHLLSRMEKVLLDMETIDIDDHLL